MSDTDLIISRADWGALPPDRDIADLAYPTSRVFLHHEGGVVWLSSDIETERRKMLALQRQARAQGYADIPYSIVGFPSGRAWEGRDLDFVAGGHLDQPAATLGWNNRSLAYMWVGNYELQTPTRLQVRKTVAVLNLARLLGRLTADFALAGHRDAEGNSTACPGRHAYAALHDLRALLTITPPPAPEPEEPPHMFLFVSQGKPLRLFGPNGRDQVSAALAKVLEEKVGVKRVTVSAAVYDELIRIAPVPTNP
jgi:hypothetical protein